MVTKEYHDKKTHPSIVVAYSLPLLSLDFLVAPIMSILQGIYAKYYGLELTAIASVLIIARVFDGVSDPLIGYWSDRMRARKPFVLAGGALFIVCAYFLFSAAGERVDRLFPVLVSYLLLLLDAVLRAAPVLGVGACLWL